MLTTDLMALSIKGLRLDFNDQCCTLSQATALKQLRVPQLAHAYYKLSAGVGFRLVQSDQKLIGRIAAGDGDCYVAAFTSGELGELLPAYYPSTKAVGKVGDLAWQVTRSHDGSVVAGGATEAHARAAALIVLLDRCEMAVRDLPTNPYCRR